jgi:short-subunit dehydrogenase
MRDPAGFAEPGIIPVALDLHDARSIAAAAAFCDDTTLLVNNAGVAYMAQSVLDPAILPDAYDMMETNYFGTLRATLAFVPVLRQHGGGAILNVLSVASWISKPALACYAASKAAAWSFTNALRVELQGSGIQVSALHVSFIDTDMTRGMDIPKLTPRDVAASALDGIAAGQDEILADDITRGVKASLGGAAPAYLVRAPAG